MGSHYQGNVKDVTLTVESPLCSATPAPEWPKVASYLELSASHLQHNLRVYESLCAGPERGRVSQGLGVVLKGNAYGHGFLNIYSLLDERAKIVFLISPVDALAARAWERSQGVTPRRIVVIGALGPEECEALAEAQVEVVVGDDSWFTWGKSLNGLIKTRLKCHIHLDTGLGREGFFGKKTFEISEFLSSLSNIDVCGVLSHFANTEDVTEQEYARTQLRTFFEEVAVIENTLAVPSGSLERHMAATAAALVLPEARLDSLRVGIGLYGLWPSQETKIGARLTTPELPQLKPVLSWRVPTQLVKTIPAGGFIGYGCAYRCPRDTKIAVCPVGYFDGYPRLLSQRAYVLVDGVRCPVLGRVMMNHIIIDVSAVPVERSVYCVTLLGASGGERLSAEQLASWADTIHYELCTRIAPHLRRVVVP